MLTPEQASTIDAQVRHLHKEHVGALLAVTNNLIARLEWNKKDKFHGIFRSVVPETAKALSEFGSRLITEIPTAVASMKRSLVASDRDEILSICEPYLDSALYFKRLTIFKESIERQLHRYAIAFDGAAYRFDLIDSMYKASIINSANNIMGRLQNRLDMMVYADAPSEAIPPDQQSDSALEEANQLLDLRPNIFGVGLNLNHLVNKWLRRRR